MGRKLLQKAGMILGPQATPRAAESPASAPLATGAEPMGTQAPPLGAASGSGAAGALPEAPPGTPLGTPRGTLLGAPLGAMPGTPVRAKTAPGSMLQFISAQSTTVHELEQLREQVRSFEGSTPVRSLDAAAIRPSKWANRHQTSFEDAEFLALKEEIRDAGGVVQPIKVREIPGVLHGATPAAATATAPVEPAYEIVFGHRRHRACLELGLPVLALVEAVSDKDLFQQMDRENRQRKNLSAWEQGCMYRQAVETGLYPSLRKLSEGIGVDVSLVSRAVALARLPEAVVAAFASPQDIQFGWAAALADVVQKDPDGVLARARTLVNAQGGQLSARQVFDALVAPRPVETPRERAAALEIRVKGRKVAVLAEDATGRAVVRFERGLLDRRRQQALAALIEDFVGKG